MKICILSDSHDNRAVFKQAVTEAVNQGAEAILHCGDLVAPSTLSVIKDIDIPIHVIHGNNTGDLHALSNLAHRADRNIIFHGQDASIKLAGKSIFIVHYPHYAQGMATMGKWDIVCCGHSHKAKIETINNVNHEQTIILNPGTVGGVGNPATYIMGDLSLMNFDIKTLDAEWQP
ncbi:MAG: metallophosphoesterase family protein [Methylococcales bacterium]|jgi:uncharacterized protein|nr:metallophosphoesterase family protein [Methylococcales bacterium]MBT7442343.1 metallophosphoesterase family protein [Methylococcales bacterium]